MSQNDAVTGARTDPPESPASGQSRGVQFLRGRARISVPEIAERLTLGRQGVYALLEQGIIPGIRLGRRWIVTRYAYEQWERTCGAGLPTRPEVTVWS